MTHTAPGLRLGCVLALATLGARSHATTDSCDAWGPLEGDVTLDGDLVLTRGEAPGFDTPLFGRAISAIGDFNGDGIPDIAVGAPRAELVGTQEDQGLVLIYPGPDLDADNSSPEADPLVIAYGGQPGIRIGKTLAAAGDVDGDGYDDLIVGRPDANPGDDVAWILSGAPQDRTGTIDEEASATLTGPGVSFGRLVAGVGDLNEDGFADVAVADDAAVHFYYGPISVTGDTPAFSVTGVRAESVANVGDVDGDGDDDVAIGEPEADGRFVHDGRVLLLTNTDRAGNVDASEVDAILLGEPTSWLGAALAPAGDVDGDGIGDLWASARRYRSGRGAVYLVSGGAHLSGAVEIMSATDAQLTGETPGAGFGESIAGDIDLNNDGLPDVVIGSPGWQDGVWNVGAAYAMHAPFASGPPSGSMLRVRGVSPSAPGPMSAQKVGQSVAAVDLNGDGFDDVIVGAPRGTADDGSGGESPVSRMIVLYGGADLIDESPWFVDQDLDGYGDGTAVIMSCTPIPGRVATGGDCDDSSALFHPGAEELDCATPEDRNCDGSRGAQDRDADGFDACQGDCNDRASAQRPSAAERCGDGIDNDCNGEVDDSLATDALHWYPDVDGDGYGDANLEFSACTQPSFFLQPPVNVGGDCDDANTGIKPSANELCNLIDDDCDGLIDTDATDPPHWYQDQDGDRFGDPHAWLAACVQPPGYVVDSGDCDDSEIELRPGTLEQCDGIDNDCDGRGYLAGVQSAWDTRVTGPANARFGTSIAWAADRGDGEPAWIVGAAQAADAVRLIAPPMPGGDRLVATAGGVNVLSCPSDLPGCGGNVHTGDVNGDGFTDLIIASPDADGGAVDRGRVAVYRGPLNRTLGAADRWVTLDGTGSSSRFGASIDVRDVNDDGKDDLLIGAPGDGGPSRNGAAWLWYGQEAPVHDSIGTVAAAWIVGEPGQRNGTSVAIVDLNGDGQPDLVSGRAAPRGELAVRVVLHDGGLFDGMLTPTSTVRAPYSSLDLGRRLANAGDFDADGREDLVIVDKTSAWVVYGDTWTSAVDLNDLPRSAITTARAAASLGHAVTSAGDADGDGYADLLLSAPGTDENNILNSGATYLVYGSPRRMSTIPVQQLTDLVAARSGPPAGAAFHGEGNQTGLGQAVAAGDMDGDGYPELAVTSTEAMGRSGQINLMRAGPHGVDITPTHAIPFSYTPTIDGSSADWVPDTVLADTWGDDWMLSWSPERISLGASPANFSGLGALYRLVFYLGNGDTTGATQGILVGSQRPALPTPMDVAISIKANGTDPTVYVANPVTGAWTVAPFALTSARQASDAIELSIPASALGGTTLDVAGMWLFSGANQTVTVGYPADAFTTGPDPDIQRWLRVDREATVGPLWVTTSPGGGAPSLSADQQDFWLDLDDDGEGKAGDPLHVCPIHVPVDANAPGGPRLLAVDDPELATDCDDNDPTVYYNALDPAGDGRDTDCDGVDGVTRIRPVVTTCVITPGDADTAAELTAFASAQVVSGGAVSWTWRWTIDGVPQTDLTGPTLPADRTARGQIIGLECEPRNSNGRGLAVSSSPLTIRNAIPTATSCGMLPNPPIGGITALAAADGWDDDGDPITWTWTWSVDGAGGYMGSTLDGAAFGLGDLVGLTCIPSDGIEDGPPLVTEPCLAVSNERPTIASAAVGPAEPSAATQLTCEHPSAVDVDGDPIAAYSYLWEVNGTQVSTSATLPAGSVHRGDRVSCTVRAHDPWGVGAPVTAITRTVGNAPPPLPTITLTPSPEATTAHDLLCAVTSADTDHDGDTISYSVSWTFAGAAWTGTTATSTLTGDTVPAAASEAGSWSCSVTPHDGFVAGQAATASTIVRLALGGTTVQPAILGGDTTCALTQTGELRCWGLGTNGIRATPSTATVGKLPADMGNALVPSQLGSVNIAAAWLGSTHMCALTDDGRVKCAGAGTNGQLGSGDTNALGDVAGELGDALPFVDLGAGLVVADLAIGDGSTCALFTDGRMKCWGYNHSARLGLGDTNNRGDGPGEMGDALPFVNVGTGRKVVDVALSGTSTCALRDDNVVVCWGASGQGALGFPTPPAPAAVGDVPAEMGDALTPVNLGPGTILDLAGGTGYACALFKDGRVKCWGSNSLGQLGYGDTNHRGDTAGEMGTSLPAVSLGTGRTARKLTAGGVITCAVLDNGAAKCWGGGTTGSNYYLGYGDSNGRGAASGTMGDALPTVTIPGGGQVSHIAVSSPLARATCLTTTCGAVWCWGNNNNGQLGLGSSTLQRQPTAAVSLGTGLHADVDLDPSCP